jgi:hypothetical protein
MNLRKKLLVIGIVLTVAAALLGQHRMVCALEAFQRLLALALISTRGI